MTSSKDYSRTSKGKTKFIGTARFSCDSDNFFICCVAAKWPWRVIGLARGLPLHTSIRNSYLKAFGQETPQVEVGDAD